MSLFSGTRLTDRDIEMGLSKKVHRIVQKLVLGQLDPHDGEVLLLTLLVRAVNAKTRVHAREGVE